MMKKLLLVIGVSYACITNAQVNTQLAQSLQKSLDSVCAIYNIKGVTAAVLIPGEGIWEGTYGISKPGEPVTKNMAFGMGSNTKTYVAALLLKLQQAGKLSLNDTIGKWIQGYPNIPGNVTIKQCINHTSGIAEYLSAAVNDSLLENPPKIWTLPEILSTVSAPNFAPGTSWSYSNTGYVIAGIIIEAVTGKTYQQAMHEWILDSAGYNHTFFYGEPNSAPSPGQWTMNLTGTSMVEMNSYPVNIIPQLFSLASTAGGLMCTASDNVRFWFDLVKGNLLDRSLFKEMIQVVPVSSGTSYGLGLFRLNRRINNRTVYSHGGTFLGFINENVIDTFSGAVVSVLNNQDSISNSRILSSVVPALHRHTLNLQYLSVAQPKLHQSIKVYPNPANHYLAIDEYSKLSEIKLMDLTGRVRLETVAQPQINTAELPDGMYILWATDKDGENHYYQRILIQH